jgi:hypothetical protein
LRRSHLNAASRSLPAPRIERDCRRSRVHVGQSECSRRMSRAPGDAQLTPRPRSVMLTPNALCTQRFSGREVWAAAAAKGITKYPRARLLSTRQREKWEDYLRPKSAVAAQNVHRD